MNRHINDSTGQVTSSVPPGSMEKSGLHFFLFHGHYDLSTGLIDRIIERTDKLDV